VSAARDWSVPPGYRALGDLVQEHGIDRAQPKLISGEWPTFEFDIDTGDLKPIPTTVWSATWGRQLLERAENPNADDGGAICTDHWFVVIVRMSERPPPSGDDPKDEGAPMVRLAKELMDAVFLQREWRRMKVVVVRKRCEPIARARGVQLPSPDSFSRAMGRRKK
jgi:hypothetical protein